MTNVKKQGEVYKCNVCGNMCEVLFVGGGEMVCCNQAMQKLEENTTDAATEKHVPVIEKEDNVYKIKVGAVPHPMQEDHYIQWIQLIADGKSYRKFLDIGEDAEAEFVLDPEPSNPVSAREYCNLHGLWKASEED